MSTDHLKLTAYFGERQRHRDGFVSDELLAQYANVDVATSVLIRGITSFGPRHELRTDETLSMSEDPPVVVAAVDTHAKITALAEQAVRLVPRGLVTVERARLLTHDVGTPVPHETVKLTVYLGRRPSGALEYRAVCTILQRHGFAGATAFLGVDGTAHGQRHRARFFSHNADVPMMIVAIGTGDQARAALDELDGLLQRPLVTIERAQLCKRAGELLARPAALPPTDAQGRPLWQKLMIHTAESALHDGAPIHRALVRQLMRSGTAGATVLRGVWGFTGAEAPHGDKLFRLGRQVPVTTIVVDRPERISAAFEVVDALTSEHGLVSAEMVPAAVIVDGGARHGSTELAQHSY